ncbi:MAG: PAS domain-containing protein [Syntrophaceae bacterium]
MTLRECITGEIKEKMTSDSEKENGFIRTRQTEDAYLTLVESTSDSMYLVDENCRFLFVNHQYLSRLGISGSDIISRAYDEFHSLEDTKIFTEKVRLVFATGKSVQQEHKSGRDNRYFLRTFSPVKETGSAKKITSVAVVSKEITDLKQIEEALKNSEEKFRSLVENINVGIYRNTSEPHGSFIQANCALAKIFGYESAQEIMKVHVSDFYQDPEDRRRFVEELSRTGSIKEKELRLKKKDGTFIWASVSSRAHYDEKGNIDWIDGVLEDITIRKQAEESLKESEEKYNRFFKTSRDCVFMTSIDGRTIDMNDTAVELFGYASREELMQVKIPDLYANSEERKRHTRIIAEYGYTKEMPIDLLRKDGTIMHTLVTAAARYDREGNVIGFQGTIRDVTERRKAEVEREKLIVKLQEALSKVKSLSGLLPICASCKKIRDDKGYWTQIELYITSHSEADFSHGLCPECRKVLYPKYHKS